MKRWPTLCLCLLWMAGCHSLPRTETAHRSRSTESTLPHNYAAVPAVANAMEAGRPIPICLDTVLRLAQDQNGQVRLARMRLENFDPDKLPVAARWKSATGS